MIRITETEKEYLLQIPVPQKERAKAIEGRIWNPDRKVWAYPRTKNIYRTLLTEFGDDLQRVEITPPDTGDAFQKPKDLEKENAKLHKQIEQINNNLEALRSAKSDEEKASAYQSTIAEQKSNIDNLERTLIAKQDETKKLNEKIDSLSEKLTQQNKNDRKSSFEQDIKNLAIASTGNDKVFENCLNEIGINETFPDEFHKRLEHILRNILNVTDRKISLYDLLEQVKDSERMSEEGINWAHTIRKQRNELKHKFIDPKTREIRILYLVVAYALLWPHLMNSLENTE